MAATPSSSSKSLRATGPVIIVILLVAAALLGYYQIIYYPTVAPTSTTTTTATPPSEFNVTVVIPEGAAAQGKPDSFYYQPDVITVYVGYNSTVIWYNNDSVPHTVTANANSPDPAFNQFGPISAPYNNLNQGDSVNFTFTVPGNYSYFCSYHNWMHGVVIVKQPPAGLLTSATTTKSSS